MGRRAQPLGAGRRKVPLMSYSRFVITAALAIAPSLCFGQQFALNSSSVDAALPVASAVTALPVSAPVQAKPLLSRWVDLSEMSESQRYRNSYDGNGARLFANGQERTAVAGHIKLDKEGRYFVGLRATSGTFFNWSYSDYIGHNFSYYAGLSVGH